MSDSDNQRRFRLYVDESGDHSFRVVAGAEWRKRYLCLFGCIFETVSYQQAFCRAIREFKTLHFEMDADDRVILHREDIVRRRLPFDCLRDEQKQNAFNADLLKLLLRTSFTAIAVVIGKYSAQKKHFASVPFDRTMSRFLP
jgi:hypothetical protein